MFISSAKKMAHALLRRRKNILSAADRLKEAGRNKTSRRLEDEAHEGEGA